MAVGDNSFLSTTQDLETVVRNLFPEGHKMTVLEPVHLHEESSGVTINLPQVKGWSVEPDRSNEVGTLR